MKFWFSKPGKGLRFCISYISPDKAHAARRHTLNSKDVGNGPPSYWSSDIYFIFIFLVTYFKRCLLPTNVRITSWMNTLCALKKYSNKPLGLGLEWFTKTYFEIIIGHPKFFFQWGLLWLGGLFICVSGWEVPPGLWTEKKGSIQEESGARRNREIRTHVEELSMWYL